MPLDDHVVARREARSVAHPQPETSGRDLRPEDIGFSGNFSGTSSGALKQDQDAGVVGIVDHRGPVVGAGGDDTRPGLFIAALAPQDDPAGVEPDHARNLVLPRLEQDRTPLGQRFAGHLDDRVVNQLRGVPPGPGR